MNAKKNHLHNESASSGIKLIQKNKKAFFEYEILDRYECGMILLGAEVKSIRENKVQFVDSFARIKNDVLTLHNMHIAPYKYHTVDALDPVRIRMLLLKKIELKKIRRLVEQKERTMIPLSLYLKHGLIKLELGVCRRKKLYDKKETLKQKTADRDSQREIKATMKEK